ncbi:hypothetical protein DM01DRAFT_1170759 [Hesseltinella vesiculosa]|uniref:Elongator complex protein 5 n=1 Tax=Hesseltinella vesiculosa TaxID=101127 RepID=A0A1X2G583_9FUNG|nr:hypothetical protein DM01DRAFT_1170759 [Hesseltinella vesiculosa]
MISSHRAFRIVNALLSLTSDKTRIVLGYHSDQRPLTATLPPLSESLNRLASVIINLDPLPASTHHADQHSRLTGFVAQDTFGYLPITANQITRGALARVEWRRKSGKVIYETNHFYLDANTNQWVVTDFDQEADEDVVIETPEPVADPTANLSFNLTLTEEQRKTKDSLVLPYLKAQQIELEGHMPSVQPPPAGGAIYYEPDAADDFDDEDPDDDLDI